jgi:site-specific DNA-cytosine methylase
MRKRESRKIFETHFFCGCGGISEGFKQAGFTILGKANKK